MPCYPAFEQRKKVVLIGDTSLTSPHFGCQLVGQTLREQLCRVGLRLTASLPYDHQNVVGAKDFLDEADLVLINGEGSLHHGRFAELLALAEQYPTALINCVYQDNPPNRYLKSLRYVSARESLSAAALRTEGVDAQVVPDVLFCSSLLNSYVRPQPTQELGITDNAQKTVYRIGPIRLRWRSGHSPKERIASDYLAFLSQYRRLCIGRFHAVIAASVLGIPFSTWDSNTWKTQGLMADMGLAHLHFSNKEDALAAVPTELDPVIPEFRLQARQAIETMFDRLAQIAENQA